MRGYSFDAVFVDECSESLLRSSTFKTVGTKTHRLLSRGGTVNKFHCKKVEHGRKAGLCECSRCGWRGLFVQSDIINKYYNFFSTERKKNRPNMKCPQCNTWLFWSRITKAQANLVAP